MDDEHWRSRLIITRPLPDSHSRCVVYDAGRVGLELKVGVIGVIVVPLGQALGQLRLTVKVGDGGAERFA